VENYEEITNAREHTAAKYDHILVPKDKAVLGSEKQEWMKVGLKTGANSASAKANRLGGSTTPIKEPIKAKCGLEI